MTLSKKFGPSFDPLKEEENFHAKASKIVRAGCRPVPAHFSLKKLFSFQSHLAGVVTLFAAGAEGGGGEDEDLLGDGVDLAHALVVVDDGDHGLPHPQGDGASYKNGRLHTKTKDFLIKILLSPM